MINRSTHPSLTTRAAWPQRILGFVAGYLLLVYSFTAIFPAPRGVSMGFVPQSAENVTFLADLSWIDTQGTRYLQQQIFDATLQMIDQAQSLIVLDMFLFNDWQGPVSETHRGLSAELSDALVAKKQSKPDIAITVISDPVNAVYGGLPSTHFEAMRAAGIDVVLTDLTKLQDSNPIYSGIWRWLIRPFGNGEGSALPNPFGPGRVSVRSYLALLNFKANHRKLLVTDDGSGEGRATNFQALISSANPHDGSSAHRNVAMQFSGNAVIDLLASEKALLTLSGATTSWLGWPKAVHDVLDALPVIDAEALESTSMPITVQVVSESRIQEAVVQMLDSAKAGDKVDLLMFYLSDRDIVTALKSASKRGVQLRVLLDVNQDAFGREKKGVPNRPVAAELVAAGIPLRWCATQGEQCHAKLFYRQHSGGEDLLLGSGNYTRRNLEDLNLETNVWLRAVQGHSAIDASVSYFEQQWKNETDRTYSVEYEQYADESLWLKLRYRVMEATGFATF